MPGEVEQIGKALLIISAVIAAAGGFLIMSGKFQWFGRLPGDILVQRKNFTFYLPLVTSVILSLALTLLFWFIGKK